MPGRTPPALYLQPPGSAIVSLLAFSSNLVCMLPILHSSHLASVLRDVIQQEFISYIAAVKDKKATLCGEKTRSKLQFTWVSNPPMLFHMQTCLVFCSLSVHVLGVRGIAGTGQGGIWTCPCPRTTQGLWSCAVEQWTLPTIPSPTLWRPSGT